MRELRNWEIYVAELGRLPSCPWKNDACIGERCMAWVQHPGCKKMGTCALIPKVEIEDELFPEERNA